MHGRVVMVVFALVALAGLGITGAPGRAQEPTPEARGGALPLGVGILPLIDAALGELPAGGTHLQVARLTLNAGVSLDDTVLPGVSVVFVEAGTPTVQCGGEGCTLVRAQGASTSTPTGTGDVVGDQGVELHPGDGFIVPAAVSSSIRNNGNDQVSLLVVALLPEAEGTPTP